MAVKKKKVRVCGGCGKDDGHNIRTCPKLKRAAERAAKRAAK